MFNRTLAWQLLKGLQQFSKRLAAIQLSQLLNRGGPCLLHGSDHRC